MCHSLSLSAFHLEEVVPLTLQIVICLSIRQWEICDIISEFIFEGEVKENFLGCFKYGANFSFILKIKREEIMLSFQIFHPP